LKSIKRLRILDRLRETFDTVITSSHNPKIQQIRSLLARRQERQQAQSFVVEGVRLVEEALQSGWQPQSIFFSDQLSGRGKTLLESFSKAGADIEEITPQLMDALADTEAPQGILATFAMRDSPLPEKLDFVLVLDNLRDPGNLGTLLRTACAAGLQAVLLTPGTTDVFSPKVLRAGMGAQFKMPALTMPWDKIETVCHTHSNPPLKIFLAEGQQGTACWELDLRQPLALIIGNEAQGAGDQARRIADGLVRIPMPGGSESLNAAVAGSIIIFEIVRQRYA
jgi:RNA methyltransferase, TrmH family